MEEKERIAQEQGFVEYTRGAFTIGSRETLSEDGINRILQIVIRSDRPSVLNLEAPAGSQTPKVLGGRTAARVYEISPWGRVFFKRYSHGGLLRKITGGKFLACGALRSKEEFVVLEEVRTLGVRAPRPIAYVKRGGILYATWLLMEELSGTTNLVNVAADTPEKLGNCMRGLAQQVTRLIEARLLHVDLHPGNVLVGSDGGVFIVDFDKARHVTYSRDEVRELYLRRWRRAVLKHALSPLLVELLSLYLRSAHE